MAHKEYCSAVPWDDWSAFMGALAHRKAVKVCQNSLPTEYAGSIPVIGSTKSLFSGMCAY